MTQEIPRIPYLIGKTVKHLRVTANSVILYLDCTPGDEFGYSIWVEPTWHLHNETRVIIGSRQLQTEDDEEFNRWIEILNILVSKQINDIQINKITNDLSIMMNEFVIRTFVSDSTDDFIWQIRDLYNHKIYEANPLEIISKDYSVK